MGGVSQADNRSEGAPCWMRAGCGSALVARAPRRAARRPRAAFTLVELTVVIVVIGVVVALMIRPMTDSWQSMNLRESAQQLLISAQYARAYAVTRGRTCRLALDHKTGAFVVEAQLDAARPGEFQLVRADLNRKRQLARGVRFGAIAIQPLWSDARRSPEGLHAVTFNPAGRADAAMIELTDGTRSWSLSIAPSTGRAELLKGRSKDVFQVRVDLDAI